MAYNQRMAERIRFHPWIARLYDQINFYFEHRQARRHRQYLASESPGTVLEIGAGTGTMIPYFEGEKPPTAYYGVEPDPGMRRQANAALREATFDGEVIEARAERLPFATGSVDTVVVSCVFCSIPDIGPALSEISRVLAADGEFRFFEHVRSSGILGRSQDYLTPLWRRFGGNCHLNREFLPVVDSHDGLVVREAEHHTTGHYPIREFVHGHASPLK